MPQGKFFFTSDDGFALTKAQKKSARKGVRMLEPVRRHIDFFTWDELQAVPVGDEWVFDVESYWNYFLVAFKHLKSGKVVVIEDSPLNGTKLDVSFLSWMLHRCLIVGFNSEDFDVPVLALALRGMTCVQLKEVVNRLIGPHGGQGEKARDVLKSFDAWTPNVNHIDLIEVCPLQGSLKKYAAKLHCKRMQELPYPPEKHLSAEEAYNVMQYCINDLDNTALIYGELQDEIKLRIELGKQYGLDLRSKSDAQIAEAIINKEVAKINGKFSKREEFGAGHQFKYEPPPFLQFITPRMQQVLEEICTMDFEISESGYVITEGLSEIDLRIGDTVYQMGKGGLHSKEKSVGYRATPEWEILDHDVESYYPRLILNSGMFPKNMGPAFLTVYEELVESRIRDKKAKNTTGANSKKIVINGTFGKLGNRYSAMYSPHLLIQVTLTGQLALLMLIEALELNGIRVISANTDGIVKFCHVSQLPRMRQIIAEWERLTGLKTEETKYAALYSRDINNYIAVKVPDDKGETKIKGKGAYFDPRYDPKDKIFRFHKSPQSTVCLKAIQALITKGVPIEKTIHECRDLSQFVTVRDVRGGAEKDGYFIGKTVRWYYAQDMRGTINYIDSGNNVPLSEGAKPCLDLPDDFPQDIDYSWYVKNTVEMLRDVDYLPRAKLAGLFD